MDYYTYIITNRSQTLYTGVPNNLAQRVAQHRSGEGSAFTAKYRCDTIVWYERFSTAADAIAAEKRIKGWTRAKKIALIEAMNPNWDSLVDYR